MSLLGFPQPPGAALQQPLEVRTSLLGNPLQHLGLDNKQGPAMAGFVDIKGIMAALKMAHAKAPNGGQQQQQQQQQQGKASNNKARRNSKQGNKANSGGKQKARTPLTAVASRHSFLPDKEASSQSKSIAEQANNNNNNNKSGSVKNIAESAKTVSPELPFESDNCLMVSLFRRAPGGC